jgi:hypothetical protein
MIISCRINGKQSSFFSASKSPLILTITTNYKQIYRNSRTPLPGDANTEAQFRVPDWGDKVDYGIGLSYRPVWLHRLAGRYDSHLLQSTLFPPTAGTMNLATDGKGCLIASKLIKESEIKVTLVSMYCLFYGWHTPFLLLIGVLTEAGNLFIG